MLAYPSGPMPCLTQSWSHRVATQLYDDRVSNPTQLWIDYYDVYGGQPSDETLQWSWMTIEDAVNQSNSGYYSAPLFWAFGRDWTVWPQRSFGYPPTDSPQVTVTTRFGIGGTGGWCGGTSYIVYRH